MIPVSAAIPRARALLAEARDPIPRASTMVCLAMLSGARGRFDEGRELFAAIRAQLSPTDWLSYEYNAVSYSARLELLAGNMQRAEELARALCAFYRAEGLSAYLSSEQMFLVDALIGQGRLDDAAAELAQAPAAASDDVDALFRQARSRAALGLARGDLEAAEEHARAAVGHVAAVESADEHAQTLLVLARVLLAAGRYEEAREILAEALRIAEERENVVLAQRAREMLAAASPVATAVGALSA
jgi:tetratricopeptide (TPR) repeat protein